MKRLKKNPFGILYVTVTFLLIFEIYNSTAQENKEIILQNATETPKPTLHVPTENHLVTRVIDGDTIEIEHATIIRYIGIDTPETKDPKKVVECFGKEAYKKNAEMVLNKYIRMEKDVSEKDRYGRLLRYVWVIDSNSATSSAHFINEYLVREGYAHAVTYPPDIKYQDLFLKAQQQAKQENKGLWSMCN